MVLGQGCPGSRSLRFPMGAGGGCKGGTLLPAHADWGRLAPIWDTDGASNHRALFPPPLPHPPAPPPWCFWASCAHPPAERILWQEGEGSGPPLGECFGRECWLSYRERKTEVEEVVMVAWAWVLAPLPLLGARVQMAVGSALTVFVGFETKPRGRENSFSGGRPPAAFSCLGSVWRA